MSEMTPHDNLFDTLLQEIRAIDSPESGQQLLARLSFTLLVPTPVATDIESIYRHSTRTNALGMSMIQCIALVDQVIKKNWLPEGYGSKLLVRTQELELSPHWVRDFFDGADKVDVDIDIERAAKNATGIGVRLPWGFWWEHPIIQSSQALYMCHPSYSLQTHLNLVRQSLHIGGSLDTLSRWAVILFGLPWDQGSPDKSMVVVMSEGLTQTQRERYIYRRAHAFAEVCSLFLGQSVKKIRRSIMHAIDHDHTFRIWAEAFLSQLRPAERTNG